MDAIGFGLGVGQVSRLRLVLGLGQASRLRLVLGLGLGRCIQQRGWRPPGALLDASRLVLGLGRAWCWGWVWVKVTHCGNWRARGSQSHGSVERPGQLGARGQPR